MYPLFLYLWRCALKFAKTTDCLKKFRYRFSGMSCQWSFLCALKPSRHLKRSVNWKGIKRSILNYGSLRFTKTCLVCLYCCVVESTRVCVSFCESQSYPWIWGGESGNLIRTLFLSWRESAVLISLRYPLMFYETKLPTLKTIIFSSKTPLLKQANLSIIIH